MSSKPLKRRLLVGASAMALVLSVVPASYAGEDDGSDDTTTTTEQSAPAPAPVEQSSSGSSNSSSGSSDTQVAKGGVQTGAGGMALATDANVVLPLSIGGALILLSTAGAGGLAFRRR
jgi:hypothetical protein